MAIVCNWVSLRVEDGLLQREASETVLLMDSVIRPMVQGLAREPALTRDAQEALSAALAERASGRSVAAIKIWSPAGTVVYSDRPEVIGRIYPIFNNLHRAFEGQVVAQFDDLDDEENEDERTLELTLGQPLLEIYAPMRESGTNRIIAVAEFYEVRESLRLALRDIRLQTWAIFASLTIAMIAILSSLAIKQQRHGLERRVIELSQLLAKNWELQCKIQNAHQRTTEVNELFLRRVSAELHDGPAQLLGFALLRLDAIRPREETEIAIGHPAYRDESPEIPDEFETVRNALSDALVEIRHISAGLAPPDLAGLSLPQALEMAGQRHSRRTGTMVECHIDRIPECVDPSLKICLYRFAQEGLNNAFRHASGQGQTLRASCENELLEVAISDAGFAGGGERELSAREGLGLVGLRGRIEAIGGAMEFSMRPGKGGLLTARFALSKVRAAHV